MSTRLVGGIIGCKDETSSWHLNEFSPCRDTRQKEKTEQKQCSTSSNMVVMIYRCMGCKDKTSTWHLNRLPDGEVTLGQQYNVGEKSTVILYTYYINRHAKPPNITNQKVM